MLAQPACVVPIPVVETERLRLRGHRMDDFAHTRKLWGDARVVKYIGGTPQTEEECWARFLRYAGHWAMLGFGYWVVEEKATGAFVGEVGFGHFKRTLEPPLADWPELGWVLTPEQQGKGYATEAVQAVLVWGRQHFAANVFTCLIHPEHSASIRVASKCGFVERHAAIYKGRPALVFETA
jgi:RimJ/RimL family protein N-acetyltransferase